MEQQNNLQKVNEPIFSRKKSLLTVGQYAIRQGVSAGVVQECARLGVVQVRKHKDKTFIVDLPLDTYKIIKEQDSLPSEAIDSALYTNKISELVNRIFKPDNDTKPSFAAADHKAGIEAIPQRNTQQAQNRRIEPGHNTPKNKVDISSVEQLENSPAVIPDLNLFVEESKNGLQAARFRIPPMRGITESIKSLSVWKLLSVLAVTVSVISICAYVWVSMDRKVQQQKLQQAYDSIGKLMTKYEEVRQQARLHEFDMMSWRSEADLSKKALLNSESELQNTRKSLSETKKDLQGMQQYNNEMLKKLNEQVSKIRSHISNAAEQPVQ
jgi:hypothetical protein